MRHHFTVDVEEYFQVSAFESTVAPGDWHNFALRTPLLLPPLLDLMARHQARGTFFILGWLAGRLPSMVKQIQQAGHEVASHGWDHRRVTTQRPAEFRESIRRTKEHLESLTGERVLGFRAPSFSIVPGLEWAFDVLLEEGYRYDSSLFPVRRPGGYGYASAARHQHCIIRPSGTLVEFPLTTLRWSGMSLPAGGGAYFRIFPYGLVRAAFRACERDGTPGTFYLHPWELDPGQPRLPVPWLSRARHYTGLRRTAPRLERLLDEFEFTALADSMPAQ